MITWNNAQQLVEVKLTKNKQTNKQKKKTRAKTWAKWAKIGPEIKFFAIFSSLVHQFSFKLYRMIDWNNV